MPPSPFHQGDGRAEVVVFHPRPQRHGKDRLDDYKDDGLQDVLPESIGNLEAEEDHHGDEDGVGDAFLDDERTEKQDLPGIIHAATSHIIMIFFYCYIVIIASDLQ